MRRVITPAVVIGNGVLVNIFSRALSQQRAVDFFFFFFFFFFRMSGCVVHPRMRECDVPRCSHGTQARADPWMSGWGVSVTPRHSQVRAFPTDGWMWCAALFPWHSRVRADPCMSGCDRGVPIAPSSESCDFVVFVVLPLSLGSPPLVVVFSVIPMALSRESRPMYERL